MVDWQKKIGRIGRIGRIGPMADACARWWPGTATLQSMEAERNET